jgi:hypothetical protein
VLIASGGLLRGAGAVSVPAQLSNASGRVVRLVRARGISTPAVDRDLGFGALDAERPPR